jgi:hypothetical protein
MSNEGNKHMVIVRNRMQPAVCQPRFVQASEPGAEYRQAAERFVSTCFKQHYGADIRHFMPLLMSLSDQHDEVKAVLGFRYADQDPLFLEHYLERPIEQLLAAKLKIPVDRSRLVEVGNLAVTTAGGGRWLITALTAYLSSTGSEWALFTIGPVLANAFCRMGLELIDIAEARQESLPVDEQPHWGSYYAQKPRVMAGNIAHGHKVLWSLCQQEQPMRELWVRAEQAGRRVA